MESGAALGAGRARTGNGVLIRVALVLALLFMFGIAVVGGLLVASGVSTSHSRPASALPVTSRHGGLEGEATWTAGTRSAPAITALRDQDGHVFSLASLHGRTVAMVFFDSHCHQECPLEGRALADAERAIPAAQRPVLVAVSVNPQDTSSSVRQAVRAWGLSEVAPWHWLMGDHAQLASAWRAYHIYVGPKVHGDIAHTEAVYLIDRRGYERSAYLYPFAPRFVTHDLRVLASE